MEATDFVHFKDLKGDLQHFYSFLCPTSQDNFYCQQFFISGIWDVVQYCSSGSLLQVARNLPCSVWIHQLVFRLTRYQLIIISCLIPMERFANNRMLQCLGHLLHSTHKRGIQKMILPIAEHLQKLWFNEFVGNFNIPSKTMVADCLLVVWEKETKSQRTIISNICSTQMIFGITRYTRMA